MSSPTPANMAPTGTAPTFIEPSPPPAPQEIGAADTHRTRVRSDRQAAAEPPAGDSPDMPPWGDDFDPQRAWKTIQNLRARNGDAGEIETLRQKIAEAEPILAEHERLRRASQTDLDRAREDLAKVPQVVSKWQGEAVRARAEALVAGKFVDAETALALIGDLSGYITADGIDVPKLQGRLDQLAQDKPFLVAQAGPEGFRVNRAQGQSGTGGAVPVDQQIKAAQERGDFATSIALKQQRYHQTQNRS